MANNRVDRSELSPIKKRGTNIMKQWIRADTGKLSKVLEFDSRQSVEIPINRDGTVKWMPDKLKEPRHEELAGNR